MTRKELPVLALGILILLNIVSWSEVYILYRQSFLKVVFFDIGQGDATLIEMASFCQIIIDGGPGKTILDKLSDEMPFYDKTIELIVLTHPEKDHLEGLIALLNSYQVKRIVWTGIVRDTEEYKAWEKQLARDRVSGSSNGDVIIEIAEAGERFFLEQGILEIFYPFGKIEGEILKDSNNTSIVAKFAYGDLSFLFTGDILEKQEKELVKSGEALRSDILKIAHHGSKTSTSEEFLKAVKPEMAVISAGRNNSYGHPHQEVLTKLEKYGIKLLRTDQEGDIKIIKY